MLGSVTTRTITTVVGLINRTTITSDHFEVGIYAWTQPR
jgi:hypothetical protein